MERSDFEASELVAVTLAAVGGINWGTIALLETNLVTEVVGSDGPTTLVYGVVGAAAVLALVDIYTDSVSITGLMDRS